MIELAINELSYLSEAGTEIQAKEWYDKFFGVCSKIEKDHKIKVVLIYPGELDIKNTVFYPTYSFGQWLNTQERDTVSSILQMLTQKPLINYPSYMVYDEEGHGVGYSYENDILLLSINSHLRWQQNKLTITKKYYNEDLDELTEISDINNCFQEHCVEVHKEFIISKLPDRSDPLVEITSGEVLWRVKERFFPSLIFCDQVENQIRYLSGSAIVSLRNYLKEFEDYFSKWKEEEFDKKAISGKPRPESVTRLRDYRKELAITCPDGKERTFSLHGNWWGRDSRMHFFLYIDDPNPRKCIIGYIGNKIV